MSSPSPSGADYSAGPSWAITGPPHRERIGPRKRSQRSFWFGAAKFRYLGPTPLIEDNGVRSHGMKVVNATVSYRFDNGYRRQLDVFNLLNSKDHQIDYFQDGRLPGEPPEGVMDVHFKPVEPFAVRLTLGGNFLMRACRNNHQELCRRSYLEEAAPKLPRITSQLDEVSHGKRIRAPS